MRPFIETATGLQWTGQGETLLVEPWGSDAVRVRSRIKGDIESPNWALLDPGTPRFDVRFVDDSAELTVGRLRVILTETSYWDHRNQYHVCHCHIRFENSAGKLLFEERARGGSLDLEARDFTPLTGDGFSLTLSLDTPPEEAIWGMGQYQNDIGDLKGASIELAHRNSQASVPFFISSAGYGLLWHNPAIGRATFGRNGTQFEAKSTHQLDYWVVAGESPAELVAAYADATGHPPVMPEYGLGIWQCKLRYWNQQQLLDVAREYQRRGLPLDVIVADFFHWPKLGDYRFEDEFWPDPAAMTKELSSMGVELMVSVWPQVSHESENFVELNKKNMLVRAERGPQVHMAFQGPSMFLDVTYPAARQWLWDILKRNYADIGVKLFWLDEAEPEYGSYHFDNYRYHAGPNLSVGNLYPQHYAKAVYDGQIASGQHQVVNLLRCAWAGSQRYGALVWSGDIDSTFTALREQVVAGIHMGVAGIPWWTTDIGGFHDGHVEDESFRELLIRWMQFGVFCPVMRLHGDRKPSETVATADGEIRLPSGAANEPWSYGATVYDLVRPLLHLREALRDYVRLLMRQAHERGLPLIRGLFFEFPEDRTCWTIQDSYMFGPDLLLAPVMRLGARTRELYLPEGARWRDAWSGDIHEGGQTITVPAPLHQIPTFIRDGETSEELDGALSWFASQRTRN
ncbi:glycoside hydrolase family 31 protein [Tessaracoccus antarcticus]|uniref:Glycoside hydrolase family 31 protein n=1 Tax=Tessaracoccus antarcticus TaxID=2479848 RepID=A0A3M0FYA4_9ACTN|nr:TIM-barrel domain-containing protein [Tessaracoccus antarcticus]RMB57468.1 glycoside hydrolase family 31 protein [Tessaracoccus antarcticus]